MTDLGRTSLLADAAMRLLADEGAARDGLSTGYLLTDILDWERRKRLPREAVHDIVLGSQHVEAFTRLLPLRLAFDRPLLLVGDGQYASRGCYSNRANPSRVSKRTTSLSCGCPATARVPAERLRAHVGNYAVAGLPITFAVEQSVIAA